MKLSIIFITYNRKIELKRAIKSCIRNIVNESEIIIIDNNSSDGTKEMIDDLKKEVSIKIRYIYSNENLGVARGRNRGISLASGEYVFFFDDDAIIESENLLEKSCEILDNDADVGAIAYKIVEPETGKILIGNISRIDKNIVQSYVGAAHMMRKKIFGDRIYPMGLFFGSEELYGSHKILKEGYKIKYVNELVVQHLPSKINRTDGIERDYNFILNQYVIRLLNYSKKYWIILTLLLGLRLIKNGVILPIGLRQIIKDIKIRYNPKEIELLNKQNIKYLIRNFGFINVF